MENLTGYSKNIFDEALNLHTCLFETKFYEEELNGIELDVNIILEYLCKEIFEINSTSESLYTDSTLTNIMSGLISTVALNSLKKKGLIGEYQEDNKDSVFFLTRAYKSLNQELDDTDIPKVA